MIAANVGTRETLCVCFVDAGLDELGCQDEVYLVLNLPIRGMLVCFSRQFVGVESVGRGESWFFANPWNLDPLSFVSPKSSYCPCQVTVCVRAYFGIPIALNYKHTLPENLCYDAVNLLVELFGLFVFMV